MDFSDIYKLGIGLNTLSLFQTLFRFLFDYADSFSTWDLAADNVQIQTLLFLIS